MEITTTQENLVEKLFAQIMKNVAAQLEPQDLTEEEVLANIALAKKPALNDANTIAMKAPWMRITIGDLFHQQPAIITSLGYTLHDADTTWEINIEDDPTMMQVPHKVSVSMGLTLISDYLPQKGGRFYSLAKSYDENGMPNKGNDNWLSDATENPTKLELDSKYLPPINANITTEAPKETGTVDVAGDYGPQLNLT